MYKTFLIFSLFGISVFGSAQTPEKTKLIELAKAYKNFMFRNEPTKSFMTDLQAGTPERLQRTAGFIVESITTDNNMLKREWLTLPDSLTLKSIYIVQAIDFNTRRESPADNNNLIDSLDNAVVPKNELVDAYYGILFASVANKIKPFNLSRIDFNLNDYNLANDTEKGILFLKCMQFCGAEIWGYMNIVKPPNTEKAYAMIKKYPKVNGMKYYEYTDLNFPDFEMYIEKGRGKESFKGYYINKYYDLLLNHLTCLHKEGAKEKEIYDLLLGSILKDREYYKYTTKKEILEDIFKEQKTNN